MVEKWHCKILTGRIRYITKVIKVAIMKTTIIKGTKSNSNHIIILLCLCVLNKLMVNKYIFHWIGPLGWFSHRVAMSVCLSVCLSPPHAIFFQASHWPTGHMTRSQASHWSPSPHPLRGTSYVSCVTCHMSHVTIFFLFFFTPQGGGHSEAIHGAI